ncbi:sugar phosphate isomerase/epimerase family protein [Lacrimispora sp. 210928-DFI.3.58]|uniref:sugar phosphate isomerase/epimerase family protein n=1 Tax=Lacrimispora sp. 210928-DFI.3.58 TaxID=2883214 RepID=UPI0015B56EEB|nr:sugar phosphate isomerase/epimerase family protein [Lacrimispora sp. 210928-DFI.3.58]MCB7317288.1 sugar phosphate isomerase/epimerase [Lacrimispora sp. 210928-DFI.3.58]
MNFKIGVTCALDAPVNSPFPLNDPDIYGTADFLAENGFDSMELHLLKPTDVDGPRIKEYCEKKGLIISSIGTGQAYGREGLSITSPDADVRRRAVQRLKDHLDLASLLECSIVIGSMRGEIPKDVPRAEIDRRMIEACKELCDYASKGKGTIVIEAIDRFETNYLQRAEEVMDIIDRVGSDKLGVHLDTYHMNMEEQDWKKPVLLSGSHLHHVHIADNNRNYPGWGLIDFKPFLEALEEIGYQDTLTIECYPWPDGKTAVLRGLKHIRELMGNM